MLPCAESLSLEVSGASLLFIALFVPMVCLRIIGRAAEYEASITQQLEYFAKSTQCDHAHYRAWHEFALMNFRIVSHQATAGASAGSAGGAAGSAGSAAGDSKSKSAGAGSGSAATTTNINRHIVPAITGFFKSIQLQRSASDAVSASGAGGLLGMGLPGEDMGLP